MVNLNIYCTTIKYYKVMEKLPPYIKPLGLGNLEYPNNWLDEKMGNNISSLKSLNVCLSLPRVSCIANKPRTV